MRIFLLCLLAVGSLAVATEVANKTDTIKHENRRLLSRSSNSVGNNEQQFLGATDNGPEHSEYQQATYTGVTRSSSGSGVGSEYTSGLSYTSGALPIGYQFHSSANNENLNEQHSTIHQLGQGSLISDGIQQFGQQGLNQPFGDGIDTGIEKPIESGVISRVVEVPINVPHNAQVFHTVQQVPQQHSLPVELRRPLSSPAVPVDVIKTYPINVDRQLHVPTTQPYELPHTSPLSLSVLQRLPIPYEVPRHAVQINSEYETEYRPSVLVGQQESSFNVHDVSHHDSVASLGQVNFESQQHNFDTQTQQHNFDFVPQHQQHFDFDVQQFGFDFSGIPEVESNPSFVEHVQPSVSSAIPEDDHQGYVYDKPTKKFTF